MGPAESCPSWVPIAFAEYDEREVRGGENPRIIEYHAATTLRASEDEVPWCSAFACWVMETASYESTRSARARSWLDYGQACGPRFGALAVLWRESPDSASGHVGFLMGRRDGTVYLLGGNQGDRVKVSPYPESRVLAYRWPA